MGILKSYVGACVCVCVCGRGADETKCAMPWVESHYPVLVLKVQQCLHLVPSNADARWGKCREGGWAVALKWNISPHFLWFLLCRTRSTFIIYLRKEIYFCGCCLHNWLITAGWSHFPPFSLMFSLLDGVSTLPWLGESGESERLLIHHVSRTVSRSILIRFDCSDVKLSLDPSPVLRSRPGFWTVTHSCHQHRFFQSVNSTGNKNRLWLQPLDHPSASYYCRSCFIQLV